MERNIVLVSAVIVVVAVLVGIYVTQKENGTFADRHILKRGLETPTVWIFLDSSEVNSRWWSDFGARSSRVMNVPLLNLCYESIVKACGDKYHVEVLSGLSDVAEKLGGWDALPLPMRNKLLPLQEEELVYIRTAILAKHGGLWIPVSTVAVNQIPELPKEKVAFFGSDPSETYAGRAGTVVPNTEILWSPVAEHPIFVEWSRALYSRIERQQGGREIRKDSAWDWTYFTSTHEGEYTVFPNAELTRKAGGKRIELEDLFASGTEGDLTFVVKSDTLFVRIPWPELKERRAFGWVLRSSEKQILESDIAIKYLLPNQTQQ